jgi:hypothetical protein
MKKACNLLITSALAVLLAVSPTTALAKGKSKEGAPLTPLSLVQDMQRAVAFIAQSAVTSKPELSPKAKPTRPFWQGLVTISEGLDAMEAGITEGDEGMIDGLEDVGGGVITLATTWGIIREAYPKSQVGRGVIALTEAYNMYLHHYGPAVARFKKGGKVTADELNEVKAARAVLSAMQPRLTAVAAKAKKNTYQQRLALDILGLIEELLAVQVGGNARTYCKFIYQWDRLENALYGYNDIIEVWYPGYFEQWSVLAEDAEAISGLFAENTSFYEGWEYESQTITNYGVYYERTAVVSTITAEVSASYEETVESWSEETAVEESSEEMEEIDEEIEIDEESDESLFEEVEESDEDEDGDGVEDEEDADDDNDGVEDEDDGDDDGDGVEDEEDDDAEDEELADEDEDDDGIDDDCEDEEEEEE